MAKIEAVSVTAVRVPLDVVTSFATRVVTAREYALVKVRSVDGVEGIGFCYGGNKAGRLVSAAIEQLLGPAILGDESCRTEGIWEDLYGDSVLHGRAGAVMRGLSALDIALWDLNARTVGLPLHHYLGCRRLDRVPAYASGGYYTEGKTPAHLGEEIASYVAAGFRAVKIKTGRLSPSEEEERLRATREAAGPDVLVMLDVNNAWDDLPTALLYVRRFEDHDPYWIEEPFGAEDVDNHARLAQATNIPVATGEIEAGRWHFKVLLDREAAAILQTDAGVCGGITEWRRIAALAAGYGVAVHPHWLPDLHAPLVAATPNARFVEYFPDDQVLNFCRLLDRQLQVVDGEIVLHEGPGLGFSFDERAVVDYALGPEPWVVLQ